MLRAFLKTKNYHLNIVVNKYSSTNANSKLSLCDKYKEFTFEEIHRLSKKLSEDLCSNLNRSDLKGEKIAVLCANNYTYLISLLGIWMANGVPLGLNKLYPNHLLEYFINDSKCKLVVNGCSNLPDPNESHLDSLLSNHNVVNYKLKESSFYKTALSDSNAHSNIDSFKEIRNLLRLEENGQKDGIILYTSGTSGPPKGVVSTRSNVLAMTETIAHAWEVSPSDALLHVLPLNHTHGLIFALLTYVMNGAQTQMLPKFNPEEVWSRLLDLNNDINSFMAVPTIYVQLVDYFMKNAEFRKKYDEHRIKKIFKKKMRLVVSGSASLPEKVSKEWESITGYRLLERYGMTEIGIGLTNPYRETSTRKRLPGAVGCPYKRTKVRIVEPHEGHLDSKHVLIESDHENDWVIRRGRDERFFGELQVKGSMVFKEYLNKPKQTKETFSDDGWFKTGDTVEYLPDAKVYRIIGRTSVDVIKSGGWKISALDVERAIMSNDMIEEVCVMGLSDPVWGQRILAVLVLKPKAKDTFNQEQFIEWCKTRLPKYSVPSVIRLVDHIKKNQLGKVNKKELIRFYEKEAKSKHHH